jgi:Reverse transcriptase (RNA-dependent DNA polymerase)
VVTQHTNGGANESLHVDVGTNGGANDLVTYQHTADADMLKGLSDLYYSSDILANFILFLAPLSFPNEVDADIGSQSSTMMNQIFYSNTSFLFFFLNADLSFAFKVYNGPWKSFDLSKEPLSYSEAMSRPDADAWRAAMEHKKKSLEEMRAFEEVDLLSGEHTIGLKWVYAYKMNAEGSNILEKAQVVAQGYSQHPGQFDETYAPVAKMASVCLLLTWAVVQDLDIYQFDCKTAFLHAKSLFSHKIDAIN